MAVKSSKIGLKNAHYAIFNDGEGTYAAPVALTTIKEMNVTMNYAQANEYNDDGLFEVLDEFDNISIDLSFTDLTPAEQAVLLVIKQMER